MKNTLKKALFGFATVVTFAGCENNQSGISTIGINGADSINYTINYNNGVDTNAVEFDVHSGSTTFFDTDPSDHPLTVMDDGAYIRPFGRYVQIVSDDDFKKLQQQLKLLAEIRHNYPMKDTALVDDIGLMVKLNTAVGTLRGIVAKTSKNAEYTEHLPVVNANTRQQDKEDSVNVDKINRKTLFNF